MSSEEFDAFLFLVVCLVGLVGAVRAVGISRVLGALGLVVVFCLVIAFKSLGAIVGGRRSY